MCLAGPTAQPNVLGPKHERQRAAALAGAAGLGLHRVRFAPSHAESSTDRLALLAGGRCGRFQLSLSPRGARRRCMSSCPNADCQGRHIHRPDWQPRMWKEHAFEHSSGQTSLRVRHQVSSRMVPANCSWCISPNSLIHEFHCRYVCRHKSLRMWSTDRRKMRQVQSRVPGTGAMRT
jgi:hypothetical protein